MYEFLQKLVEIPIAHAQMAAAGDVADETQGELANLVSTVISKIPLWITAFIVIVLTFIVARIVKSSVENKMITEGFEEEHKELSIVAGRTANAIVLTLGLTIGLKIAGIDLTTIIAAGAFGIGFALKDLIMNFIAGVMILSARHYTIGDIIKVKNVLGKIEEIQSRATIVKNFDGTKVVIPNAELFKNPVTSFTSNPFRRVAVNVGVEYGSDLKKAMDACLKAAKGSKNALVEPKPGISIVGFGQSSIDVAVKVWVESSKGIKKTRTDLVQRVKKELDAVGIRIPFPVQTLVFDEDIKRERKEHLADVKAEAEEQEVDKLITETEVKLEPQPEPTPEAKPEVQPAQETQAPEWAKKAAEEQPEVELAPAPQPEQTPQPEAPAPTEQPAPPTEPTPEQQTPSQ